MKSTIDAAGRIVIPKVLRARLGLMGRRTVDIHEREGHLEIEPAPTPTELVRRHRGRTAMSVRKRPPLTDEIVRDTIERIRR